MSLLVSSTMLNDAVWNRNHNEKFSIKNFHSNEKRMLYKMYLSLDKFKTRCETQTFTFTFLVAYNDC